MKSQTDSRKANVKSDMRCLRLVKWMALWITAFAIGFGSPGGALALDPADVCLALDISAIEPTTVLFVDGFESADLALWSDPAPAFSATEISDVVVEVTVIGDFEGDATLELKMTTPNHNLYQVLTAPVSSDPQEAGWARRVTGFPHPLAVQRMSAADGDGSSGSQATLNLPVGGTLIVQSSLYGLWEVSAYLNGTAAGCDDPKRFVLVQ